MTIVANSLARAEPATMGTVVDFDALMRLSHLAEGLRATQDARLTGLPGGFAHRRHGRGLEVHDLRAWQAGDDPRHIDRNASARAGELRTRQFRDERDRVLLLCADFRPCMQFGTRRAFRSVAAAEALALVGWQASAEGGRVGACALAAGDIAATPAVHGARPMASVLGLLARAHAAALGHDAPRDPPLATLLEAAARLAPAGATLCVASGCDTLGDGFDALLGWLSKRNAVQFIIPRDAFEQAPPPGHFPYVASDGRMGRLSVGRQYGMAEDPRSARLVAQGATAVFLDVGAGPEACASALGALQADATGARRG